MKPLTLHANSGSWRLFILRKSDKSFEKFSEHVWRRDSYTCQFCSFQARQYQEVINIDNDYHNNKLSNMVTACCFCTQCFFLEAVGKGDYGGGSLIYLPEISQAELNGFCHVLFCAIGNATDYRSDAQNIYRVLKMRSNVVEEKLGEGLSNPALVGQILLSQQRPGPEKIVLPEWLSPLRLLPARGKFTQQVQAWAAAALEEIST